MMTQAIMEELQRREQSVNNWKSVAKANADMADLIQSRYDSFKHEVVATTANYDGGCAAGKQDFLQQLGLDLPNRKVRITLDVEFGTSNYGWELSEYESDIVASIEASGDDIVLVESLEV